MSAKVSHVIAAHDTIDIKTDCGWFIIDSQTHTYDFINRVDWVSQNAPYTEQLFYCCPDNEGDSPECRRAVFKKGK